MITPETPHAYQAAAQTVENMTDDAIYLFRMAIAALADRMAQTAREYQDQAETRARGYAMRESANRVRDRLESVTRPR
jgi:hypothetical protein